MKPSHYNFSWKIEGTDKVLLYNSLTNCLITLDGEYKAIWNKGASNSDSAMEYESVWNELITGGFVIDDNTDELSIVEVIYNSQKYGNNTRDITIAPTMACDFRCIYCYEQEILAKQQSFMSEEIQDQLVSWFEREAQRVSAISVTWFGGEPLLAQKTILSLSRRFLSAIGANNVAYAATMISNGYGLNRNQRTIELLRECQISGIQITVDGPSHIHNRRRKLRNSTTGTFDTIIENIEFLHSNDISVTLRVNVDKTNIAYIKTLLDILKERGLTDLPINLGSVQPDTQGCKLYEENCLSIKQFSLVEREFYEALYIRGFEVGRDPPYPRLACTCVANRRSSVIIDPDGDMYKCRADIGNKTESIGNIKNLSLRTQDMRMKEITWIAWSPLNYIGCRECRLLPLCMGGCGHRRMFDGKIDCTEWKYNLEHFIKKRCPSSAA